MTWKITLIILFVHICPRIYAQQYRLSGKILDLKDNSPLIGCTILAKGTDKGTVTDTDGHYSISLPPGEYTVKISYLGYNNKEEKISVSQNNPGKDFFLQPATEELDEIVVKGIGQVQKIRNQPYQVSVLDAKPLQIQSQPVTGLVNQISGVRVREDGGIGSKVNIMLNGIGGKGVRIFVDNIPADLLGSGMAINNLPVNMIDHIEVFKGVIPAKFGSDALGGILNLVTHDTKKDYLDISGSTGSFGTYRGSLNSRKYFGTKKKFYTGISGFYNHSDNNYWMDDVKIRIDDLGNTETGRVQRFNDTFTSYLGRVSTGVRNISWANEIQINLSASQTNKEWQHGLTAEKPWGETFSEQTAVNTELRWKKYGFLNGLMDATLNAGYNYIDFYFEDIADRTYYWGAPKGIDNFVNKSSVGETGFYENGRNPQKYTSNGFMRLNLTSHMHENHTLTATSLYTESKIKGHDRRGIATFGTDILDQPQTIEKSYIGLALESKFFNKKLTNILSVKNFSGSSKVIVIKESRLTDGQEKNSYNKLGYGDALKYDITPVVSAMLNYEFSLRMPDEEELFGDFITIYPNAKLEPEESHNISIGIRFESVDKTFSSGINGFYRYTSNLIFLNSLSIFRSVYMNLLTTETNGAEGEIRYQPTQNLGLFANATWQDIRLEEIDPDGDIDKRYIGTKIPNTPWLFGNAGVNYSLPFHFLKSDKIQLYYSCNYVHEFFLSWEVDGLRSTKATIPEQIVHSGGIAWLFYEEKFSLSLESQNLTDEKIYDNYLVQKPGRSFHLKLRLYMQNN